MSDSDVYLSLPEQCECLYGVFCFPRIGDRMRSVSCILDLIGNTPIVKLAKISHGTLVAKLEYFNPTGSLKDRIALHMIDEAKRSGYLRPGDTIIDASTGNTGISLSFVGAMRGHKVIIFHPALGKVSEERVKIMRGFGAEVRLVTPPTATGDRSVSGAEIEIPLRRMCYEYEADHPNVWWARQFSNPANTAAHRETARELLKQTRVDVFVASIGTGGTLMGIAEELKRELSSVRIVGIQPESSKLSIEVGVPYPRSEVSGGIISDLIDSGVVDDVVRVSDADAVSMTHRLWREEGVLAGVSSGANVLVAKKEAEQDLTKTVATILPDSGCRYLSDARFVT